MRISYTCMRIKLTEMIIKSNKQIAFPVNKKIQNWQKKSPYSMSKGNHIYLKRNI